MTVVTCKMLKKIEVSCLAKAKDTLASLINHPLAISNQVKTDLAVKSYFILYHSFG